MDSKTPIKLLEVLYDFYDQKPTAILTTNELAKKLKISITEAKGGCIYLREKNWINSFQTLNDEWGQKISAIGIDELQRLKSNQENSTSNTEQNLIVDKLTKIESKIKEASLEKERRKEVTEQKVYGAAMEMLDILRDEIKRRDKNSTEIIELKSRLSKLENLFSNPHEQLTDNVYRPCYDQMMNIYDTEFFTSIPSNPWDDISPSWRLKTNPEIKNLFKNYSKELEKWHNIWVDFTNQFQKNNKNIAEFLEPIFEKFGLIKENDRFVFGGSTHDAESWLFNCQDVIFNENIANGEELYQILKRNSIKKWGDRYAITYDTWKKEIPEIYNEILKMIPKLMKVLGAMYSYKEIDEQRNILKKSIEELTLALEKKVLL